MGQGDMHTSPADTALQEPTERGRASLGLQEGSAPGADPGAVARAVGANCKQVITGSGRERNPHLKVILHPRPLLSHRRGA